MPSRRFDWHEHILEVEGEHKAARFAVSRLTQQAATSPEILGADKQARANLRRADENLEGTYFVRLFAAFEAALRSYDRSRHNDPSRSLDAAVLIDSLGGRRGHGIPDRVRKGAHEARAVRNFWAHENEVEPAPMSLAQARSRLQTFLSFLPEEWD